MYVSEHFTRALIFPRSFFRAPIEPEAKVTARMLAHRDGSDDHDVDDDTRNKSRQWSIEIGGLACHMVRDGLSLRVYASTRLRQYYIVAT